MKLNDLLKGINILSVNGDLNIDINNIAYDSRKVKENTLFICIKGFNSDGHKYIESAIEKGAKAFLVQEDINIEGYTFIKVEDTIAFMGFVYNQADLHNPRSCHQTNGISFRVMPVISPWMSLRISL